MSGKGSDAFRTLTRLVQRGMKDKVSNVFLSSRILLQTLIDVMGPSVGASGVMVGHDDGGGGGLPRGLPLAFALLCCGVA